MEEQKKKGAKSPKKQKKQHPTVSPITEPALPMLLSAVVFVVCFITLIINKFVYPIGEELLAPVILQLVALIIPAYLVIMLTAPEKSAFYQMRETGFHHLRAEYIFFVLFASLFTVCASLTLTLALGGAHDASNGITLLGSFTAGEHEYSVSIPYIILTYAIIPAFAEELLFRGVIFSRLEKVSFPFAALVSTAVYALAGFTLGGLVPSLFVGVLTVFVLYTTRSLWACVILHFLFNIYRLFLEANISAYFLSSQNNVLLVTTVVIALCVSALLFFSESARIFRNRAKSVASGKTKSAKKLDGIRNIPENVRASLAFKPTLIFSIICICIFMCTVIINYIV